ncbi:hypothetical protein SAMN05444339_101275 [Loktanella atrilutea]|uniref:Uncharacterized protein n=1 Tax=Loktanella atrilutea TaxID=366533 RepID=A0A1M4T6U7_LOKAT|nr:hypothetical protein [Loktanella atrilutea]SHE40206.1 hypothetical protein SAMN05444339_101275 [Loktanella atrilutea]
MDDIKALETRIVNALDRIRAGLGAQADAGEMAALQAELERERAAHAGLQDRMARLQVQQDGRIAELESRCGAQADHIGDLDAELQQLRASNADLTQLCAQLRGAATAGAADPELINRALLAEVDGLTAQRSAEAAEVAAILSDLKPLLQREG